MGKETEMWTLSYDVPQSEGDIIHYEREYETYELAYAMGQLLRPDVSWQVGSNEDHIFVVRVHLNNGSHYQVMTLFHTRTEAENYIFNSPVNPSEDRIEIIEYAPIPF